MEKDETLFGMLIVLTLPVYTLYAHACIGIWFLQYCVFPLLGTCAYISTGRKPALNSKAGRPNGKMHLTLKIATFKKARILAVSFKEHGPIERSFVLLNFAQLEMVLIA